MFLSTMEESCGLLNKLLSFMSKVSKYSHINIQRICDFNKYKSGSGLEMNLRESGLETNIGKSGVKHESGLEMKLRKSGLNMKVD
jgi:hypothetical protein